MRWDEVGRGGQRGAGEKEKGAAGKKARGGGQRRNADPQPKSEAGTGAPKPRRTVRPCSPQAPGCPSVRPRGGRGQGTVGVTGPFWSVLLELCRRLVRDRGAGLPLIGEGEGSRPCAPHTRCPPSSPRPRPLRLTFPHFWASLRPPWVPSPFQVARPGARPARLPSPSRPRQSHPRRKQTAPEGTSRERAAARRHTRQDERGGRPPPRGPRANNGRAADCRGHLKLEGRELAERGPSPRPADGAASRLRPRPPSFLRSPFVWNYLNGRSVAALC